MIIHDPIIQPYYHSSEHMDELEDNSIHLVVTSPPYNVGLEYELQPLSDKEWTELMVQVLSECKRVLTPDGRICWNVADMIFRGGNNKDFFSPLVCSINAFQQVGLNFREFITWNQMHIEPSGQTAWGSWLSASSPFIRHKKETIIVGYKDQWKRLSKGVSTITKDEFIHGTMDIWDITPETRDVGFPAAFPERLVARLIHLLTYEWDNVLDPFLGSGTTLRVCRYTNRNGYGYEINKKYKSIITSRALLNQTMLGQFFKDKQETKR